MLFQRILLLSVLLCAVCFLHGQFCYRVKEVDSNLYILPPGTHLKFKNKSQIKPKHRYAYIYLKNLGEKYSDFINSFKTARTWQGSTDYFNSTEKEFAKKIAAADKSCSSSITITTYFNFACLSRSGTSFFIQIDIEKLTADDPVTRYNKLVLALFRKWTAREGEKACDCSDTFDWPYGTGTELINKMKEWIPVPFNSELSLSAPGVYPPHYSFLFLNPDIILKVDTVAKTRKEAGDFTYDWKGTNLFSFHKDRNGNLFQNKFALFNSGLPNNQQENYQNSAAYKLSSFADIQNSSALKDFPYPALLHPKIKRNNGSGSTGDYLVMDDDVTTTGNAMLVHLNSSDIPDLDFSTDIFDENGDYPKSLFGLRNAIQPLISVYINNSLHLFDLYKQIKDIKSVPNKNKIFRKYGNDYRKVKKRRYPLTLLTNDQIKYKL